MLDALANACDDAAAATCDNAEADKPVEGDAAVDDVAAFCPIAPYEDGVGDAGSNVEAGPNGFADRNVVGFVEFTFTTRRLVCAQVEASSSAVSTYRFAELILEDTSLR